MNLMANCKLSKVQNQATAATSAINSDVIDRADFEGVVFFCKIAVANAGNYIKVQQGDESDLSDAADLEGTKVTPGADNMVSWVDVYRPTKRYLRVVVTRGASTACGDIYAMKYGPKKLPTDNEIADTITGEIHASPAEGTA